MINEILKQLLRLLILLFVQVLIVNNINLSPYVNPYIYIMLLLMLRANTSRVAMLFIGFGVGLLMDMFSSTVGLHTFATTLLAYIRPRFLTLSLNKEDFESNIEPNIATKGFIWFFTYSATLIFIHHMALFFLEIYGFKEFFATMQRVLYSTSVTLLMVILGQFLFFTVKPSND
jgi:rod shape-determining protein MreD